MNYFKETPPPKKIPIEYKHKELITFNYGGQEIKTVFNLKKSSLDLSAYTHYETYLYYGFDAHLLYNEEIITFALFTGVDYGTDDYVANLFYHKTFNRKEIVNNKEKVIKAIDKINNKYLVKEIKKVLEDKNFIFNERLNFSPELPLATKDGWYNTYTDEIVDCLLFSQTKNSFTILNNDELISVAQMRSYEYRNKIKTETDKSIDIKESDIDTLITNEIYSYENILEANDILRISRKIKIKDKEYFFTEKISKKEEKHLIFWDNEEDMFEDIEYTELEETEESIKVYNEEWGDKELKYLLKLKENPKSIMSLSKELVFDYNIKTFLDEKSRFSATNIILLENGDLYFHYKDYDDSEALLLMDKDIDSVKYLEDLNYDMLFIKTKKAVFYIEQKINNDNIIFEKIEFEGEGVPFFYEKKSNKKYDKYIYVTPSIENEGKRGNLVDFNEIKKYDYFDFNTEENLLIEKDFSVKFDNYPIPITSTQGKRNNPYDQFIKKSNYILAISTNKKEFYIFVENKNNVFEEVQSFCEYDDEFKNLKGYIKLTNLPEKIEYSGERHKRKINFIYSDYRVEIEKHKVNVIPNK